MVNNVLIPDGYKQTEVGIIPSDWEVNTIKKTAPLQRGFDLPTKNLNVGDYPVVYSNGMINAHNEYKVKGPGIVTGRSGTIGKVTYIENNFWPHNTTLWVTDFYNNIPKFVFYLYSFIKFERFATGSGVPTLNRNDIHLFKIPLPLLPEQEAIAEVFGDVDALITALDALIVKKRHIKQGALQQLLTGQKRLPGFTGKWETKKLGSILKVKHGKSHKFESEDGEFPILASGGIIGKSNLFLYNRPSVLIGRKGTIDKPQFMKTPFWSIDTLFYTEISNESIPLFIFYKFQLINWYSYNEASGIPSLNSKTIESIEVFIPTKKEQEAIAQVLSDMDAGIESLENKRRKLVAIKTGMMHRLLTGKTRLK